MKITKSQLKRIIKEEIQAALSEQSPRDRMRRSMDDFGDEFDAPAKPARKPEQPPAEPAESCSSPRTTAKDQRSRWCGGESGTRRG